MPSPRPGRGVPFRLAHEAVGGLLRSLAEDGRTFAEATSEDLVSAHAAFVGEDLARLDPTDSVRHRVTPGGGSFGEVEQQLRWMRASIEEALEEPTS